MNLFKKDTPPIDQAFVGSDKHTLKHALGDIKLQPWTPERMMKAKELGMLWPNLGKERWEQIKTTNVYAGAPTDVSIFVYLCTLDPDKVEDATRKEAKAFGVSRGFHDTDSASFWDAYNKFADVIEEIKNSATAPKGAPLIPDEEGND
jgi:hypothetical protein